MAAGTAADLIETLAGAVQAAHRGGVVHRDLKPSNVLFTADLVPKIADFGLAKLLGSDSARTLSGEALGTPSYTAPEQAEGRSRQVGPAADVCALGAILYHALTGRPPFLGDSAIETLKLVASTEVVPRQRQRPGVPRDLETICWKCLEKDPRTRYASAPALADDLRRFQECRPIMARPVGPAGRLWRWGRRNPKLSLASAALFVTLLLGTPALFLLWLRARDDRARAEISRNHAARSRDRWLGAVQALLTTGSNKMTPEVRPYRQALIRAGLAESQALVEELEGDPRAENQRVAAYFALADVQHEGEDRQAALDSARKAIALAEGLVRRHPASVSFHYSLAEALHRLAAMWPAEDEFLRAARRSIEICKALRDEHTGGDRREWGLLIAMNQYNVGNLHFTGGRVCEALESLLAARTEFQTALDLGDDSPRTLYLAARTQLYLCRLYSDRQHLDEAMLAGCQAIDRFRSLVASDPDNLD